MMVLIIVLINEAKKLNIFPVKYYIFLREVLSEFVFYIYDVAKLIP